MGGRVGGCDGGWGGWVDGWTCVHGGLHTGTNLEQTVE